MRRFGKVLLSFVVNAMSDTEAEAIASERLSAKCQTGFLELRIQSCNIGITFSALQEVIGIAGCFVDRKYWIRLHNILRFLSSGPHNANVVDFADRKGCSKLLWLALPSLSEKSLDAGELEIWLELVHLI